MPMRSLYGRLVLGAVAAGAVWLACSRTSAARIAPAYSDLPASQAHNKWMGVASCSSSACHGGDGPTGGKRSEYTTWVAHDKHARAYRVLFEERSRRIARNLPEPDGRLVEAHEKALCLKCHASNNGEEGSAGSRLFRADGIGCESCHGPAERWLTVHYQAGFKEKSAADKAHLGLLPTKDLTSRAKQCVACHVGDAEKEVNHDLIAAGHPRLSFEFAAYLALYPKHWNPADDRQRYPDFAARAWMIGQVTSARAALDLLQARAEGADADEKKRKPWPEFSEYDCFACHKDLKVDSPRQLAGYGVRRPGAFPYGNWYLTVPLTFARLNNEKAARDTEPVAELRRLMQRASPPAKDVARQTAAAGRLFEGLLRQVESHSPYRNEEVRALLANFVQDGAPHAGSMGWDEAAQVYLGVAALHQALSDEAGGRSDPRLERAVKELGMTINTFQPGFNSPVRFNPERFSLKLTDLRKQLSQ
jgi:hypothetical protein